MKNILLIFIFIMIFSKSLFAKDLSGNAIDCYSKTTYQKVDTQYYANIKFLSKSKVKFAIAIVRDSSPKKEFRLILPENTFTYEVQEEVIVIKVTKNVKNISDPFDHWKYLVDKHKGRIVIYRKTLNIFDEVLTVRAVRAGSRMKCKLVDYDDETPFNKYIEFNNLFQKYKKESESKNIL